MKVDHELKCWPEHFMAIQRGIKNFDIRKGDDRIFKPGDVIEFREWDPVAKAYTGHGLWRIVCFVTKGGLVLPPDIWVLGLKIPDLSLRLEALRMQEADRRGLDFACGWNGAVDAAKKLLD